jgi:hypothetical protein
VREGRDAAAAEELGQEQRRRQQIRGGEGGGDGEDQGQDEERGATDEVAGPGAAPYPRQPTSS